MRHILIKLMSGVVFFFCLQLQAAHCPNPYTSSLRWGEIPPPWELNPFSATHPQEDRSQRFLRANILVAGIGRGVVCIYRNSVGGYSIWWQVPVKAPSNINVHWRRVLGGYECSDDLGQCEFFPGKNRG